MALLFLFASGAAAVQAAESALEPLMRQELSKSFPEARIELMGDVAWTRGAWSPEESAAAPRVRLTSLSPRGDARFTVSSEQGTSEAMVRYAAWVPARIAIRRIHPGEKLGSELFSLQDVNVATGQGYEYRGVILSKATELSTLQSRQTVLEGQFLTSTAVEKIPDVRRGDVVRIELNAGELQLTTQGVAEEPAYLNTQVRVMAGKTKRELVGMLKPNGVVEVNL
jgi:flagella basal body P-ring formation protein FlgA